jgi:MFS family permease
MGEKHHVFSKSERRLLLFANAGHFFAHSLILIFPQIITPLMREFGLQAHEVLKLSFFMYLFFGIGALPSGFLADRIKPKITFTIFFTGVGLTSILTFFSRSTMGLRIALMFMGMFLSMYHPLGIGLISKAVKKRGSALGLNGVFGSIGIAAAPFIAGIISYLLGWRSIYLIMGIPPLFLGILLHFTGFDYTLHESDVKSDSNRTENGNVKAFAILCISMCLAGFVYRGQTLLLPQHFERNVHFLYNLVSSLDFMKLEGTKTLAATILTSFVYMIGVIGQLIGGRVADSVDLRYAYFLVFLAILPILPMLYFFSDIPLFAVSLLFILLLIGMQPVENSLIAQFTPLRWRSTSYGIKFILTFGISSSVIYPIGFFQSRFSFEAPFLLFFLVALLLVVNNGIIIAVTGGKGVSTTRTP